MLVFRKIWCALFSCYLLFEIRPFALSPTNCLWTLPLTFSMILRFSEVWKAIHFHVFLPSVIAVTTTVSQSNNLTINSQIIFRPSQNNFSID